MKIELDKIETAMSENGIDEAVIAAVITQLKSEIAEEDVQPDVDDATPTNDDLTDGAENLPKVKMEYVIILNDKEGFLKDKEIAGWVVQQEENADAGMILPHLFKASKDQNASGKRKHAIDDMVGMFESLKPKFTKENHIKIKTKDLTRVIVSSGKFL